MPMRPRISTLPASVRAQLDRKLKAAAYGNLVAIAAWLESKGHPIKKSAVGAYSKRLQAADAGASGAQVLLPQHVAAAPSAAALRLACLQVAASGSASTVAVLKRADAFAAWVKTGKPPKAAK